MFGDFSHVSTLVPLKTKLEYALSEVPASNTQVKKEAVDYPIAANFCGYDNPYQVMWPPKLIGLPQEFQSYNLAGHPCFQLFGSAKSGWNLLNMSNQFGYDSDDQFKSALGVKIEAKNECDGSSTDQINVKKEADQFSTPPPNCEERPSPMKLNKRYQAYVRVVKEVYQSKEAVFEDSFEGLHEKEINRYKKLISDGLQRIGDTKSVEIVLNGAQCNLTKYVKGTLKCMVRATADLLVCPNYDAAELFDNIHKCTKIQHFREAIFEKGHDGFAQFLKEFVVPGHLFVIMINKMNYSPVVSVLMLEALLVLQRMIQNPNAYFGSWKLEKLNIVGDYADLIKDLEEGKGSFNSVRSRVQKEYEKRKDKFKKTKCSEVNNVTYFLCQTVEQMLTEICLLFNPDRSSFISVQIGNSKVRYESEKLEQALVEGINLLRLKHNEESLLHAIEHPFIKVEISKRFIQTKRLLKMILETRTNALMIKNLIDRYTWLVSMFHVSKQ